MSNQTTVNIRTLSFSLKVTLNPDVLWTDLRRSAELTEAKRRHSDFKSDGFSAPVADEVQIHVYCFEMEQQFAEIMARI